MKLQNIRNIVNISYIFLRKNMEKRLKKINELV